ncbi:TnsA endonuclease N-terminal domain-containing protein [Pacificispira sp.]|uniref:TnsA endonuclease N-terminal domain-containing protein n=1 Tax=Pacificispira sp. TaxID=2888761 RepID=UPI003BA8E900
MIYRLEACPFVQSYRAQPSRCNYFHEGAFRTYVPDFHVQTKLGEFLVEVKPDDVLNDPDEISRLRSIAKMFRSRGTRFRLFLEAEIRRRPYLQNAELVNRYRFENYDPPPRAYAILNRILDCGIRTTAAEITNHLDMKCVRHAVLPLISLGLARMNFSEPFGAKSVIWRPVWEATL